MGDRHCFYNLIRSLSARIHKRILIGSIVAIFLCIKWARITVPEKADTLAVLPTFAEDPGRSFFPPVEHGCVPGSPDMPPASAICAGFPLDPKPRVQVVLKTGASERDKTKMALSTLLACSPGVQIFSDAEDEIDGHPVIDVLAALPSSYALNNPDWEAYTTQKEALLQGEAVHKSPGGWKLDRYKFLPMIEKAYDLNPDADWYFFVEGDTYFFWDTLYRLLDRLDADERHYIGTAVPGSSHTFFGYGGAGLILSSGLMRGLLHERTERLSVKYEQWVRRDCCGDALLAYVLREELDVRIENAYPTLSGEALCALGVSEKNWCHPLLSLHRVDSELMERLWRWERCRAYDEGPVFLSSILDFALSPTLRNGSNLAHWNNFSDQQLRWWHPAHWSTTTCAQYCAGNTQCLQWTYAMDRCRIAKFIKQGHHTEDDVTSGWDLLKLERLGYKLDGN